MPQGVERKVSDVGIFQQTVIVVLESFLLKVVAELVCDDKAVVSIFIPCPQFVLRLLLFPAGKFVRHCAGQRDDAAGVLGLGCAEYDLGFVLAVKGFIFCKAVNGTTDVKLGRAEINIFPLQCQQFPHPQPGTEV